VNGEGVLGPALIGIATFLVSQAAWDLYTRNQLRKRLVQAFMIDALASLRVCDALSDTFGKVSDIMGLEPKGSPAFDRKFITPIPSWFVVSGTSLSLPQLLEWLEKDFAVLALKYSDRWERLLELEKRYAATFSSVLETIRDAGTKDVRFLEDEYWTQLRACARLLLQVNAELALLCCYIVAAAYHRGGGYRTVLSPTLSELSENRWKTLGEVQIEVNRLEGKVEERFAKVMSASYGYCLAKP
jgi:hypothetical protein